MNRLCLGILSCALLLGGVVFAGCGSEESTDPNAVVDRFFVDFAIPQPPGQRSGAEIEVASLGFDDQELSTRILSVNPGTYASIREAIAGPEGADAEAERPTGGFRPLLGELESLGVEDLDGEEVEHVSGDLDVERLVSRLTAAIESGGSPGSGNGLPGLGDLEQLEQTLVEATLDLYVSTGESTFRRLDLTLSLDDRDNALPPTRIRFSLTEAKPEET